jgi:hypothetical protein
VPFNVVQFKNFEESRSTKTDVYINYAMKLSNQLSLKYKFPAAHKYGLFLLDKKSDVSAKKTDIMLDNKPEQTLRLGLNRKFQINSIQLATEPDSVQMAFEVMRISDNGISANRFNFRIKNFDRIGLDLSDILLAEDVTGDDVDLTLKRNNLNILPNPMNEFTAASKIFIYYEVYNLTLDENKTAYFEQRVTISKIEEHSGLDNAVNSVIDFLGFGSEEDGILLSTKYQSFNRDIPVYFQIDMSKYTKGDYKLSIEVEDLESGKRVRNDTMLKWR